MSHRYQVAVMACISLFLFALSVLVLREELFARISSLVSIILGILLLVKAIRMIRTAIYKFPENYLQANMTSNIFLIAISLTGYWISHAVWALHLQYKLFGWQFEEFEGTDPFAGVVAFWFVMFGLILVVELYWTATVLIKGTNRQRLLMLGIASTSLGQLATMFFLGYMLQGV